MQMRTMLAASLAVLLLASGLAADDEKDEPSFWMKQKLNFSQAVLNGLAKEDFDLIQKNALAMKGLNKIELFIRQKPEGYRTQLMTFQFSVNELVRNAEAKNLDGATLAFTQMTISCVNCHKVLRAN
jgi:cytochrome c556